MFLPHLFRKPRNAAESTGVRKEKVPLDAHEHHLYRTRKTNKMIKGIWSEFALRANVPADAPDEAVWSIATGEWVPRYKLKLGYIFPVSLGPMVCREISHRINFRGPHNGLLIPPTVREAIDEVSRAPRSRLWNVLPRKGAGFRACLGDLLAGLAIFSSLWAFCSLL